MRVRDLKRVMHLKRVMDLKKKYGTQDTQGPQETKGPGFSQGSKDSPEGLDRCGEFQRHQLESGSLRCITGSGHDI